jgi:hypothetical protein
VHGVTVLPFAWLDGTEVAQWWLDTVSIAARSRDGAEAIAEAEGESKREDERVEDDFSTATTRDGIRLCPRGTVATGSVRSPSHHLVRCQTRAQVTSASR